LGKEHWQVPLNRYPLNTWRIRLERGVAPSLLAPAVDPVEGAGAAMHSSGNGLAGGLGNRLTSRLWVFLFLFFNPLTKTDIYKALASVNALTEAGNQLPPLRPN
jgi:hypothetical protein